MASKCIPLSLSLDPGSAARRRSLARLLAGLESSTFFDLEDPRDAQRLSAPLTVLEGLSDLVVIDEVQRRPELWELLRVLVDRPRNPARFLLLGSASPALVKGVSESLAGRVGFVDLGGFSLAEVGVELQEQLWARGGFPRSFLAVDEGASTEWRQDFIRTFLERDVPQLGIRVPAETLRRFWTMVAHYHGQVWNAAEIGRSLGFGEMTARRYLDILAGAFVARVLPPWHENLAKRQIRSPKVYLRDSGLLHTLLQLPTLNDVRAHPKLGASWEGFALEEILSHTPGSPAYFWGSHGGAELDLLLFQQGRRLGVELKYADAPGMTRSMHIALEDLKLERLWVAYPGSRTYDLHERVTVTPLPGLVELLSAP